MTPGESEAGKTTGHREPEREKGIAGQEITNAS